MEGTNNQVDPLRIKIDQAISELPEDTRTAIETVKWKEALMSIREKKGYTFEQLGDLETETELVLCGLLSPAQYPNEVRARLRLTKAETDELINDMNNLVFKRIKEELIKITENRKLTDEKSRAEEEMKETTPTINTTVLKSAGIEVVDSKRASTQYSTQDVAQESRTELLKKVEHPEIHPMLAEKLSNTVQTQSIKTEHTLDNLSKEQNNTQNPLSGDAQTKNTEESSKSGYKVDPYRMIPE